MQNFVYIVSDDASRKAVVVDSGWELGPVLEASKADGLSIDSIIATHEHFDHTKTLHELASRTGAEVVAHVKSPLKVDRRVEDGDVIQVGNSGLRVLYTPGHTEDSICLDDGEHLFTGDTLFIGACGRTDLPGGSAEKLFQSLHGKIMKLPPGLEVNPGHDYGEVPRRRLSEEALRNPALRAKNLESFLRLFG